MKVFIKKEISIKIGKRCTLLIPEFILPYYSDLFHKHGSLNKLISILLNKFYLKKEYQFKNKHDTTTVSYQEKGLGLSRIDFRTIETDWIELKLLANSYNMSVCAFFVLLLRLDMAGSLDLNFGGVPPKFPKITLHQSITLFTIPVFKKFFHLRE